ncbi:MAG: ferredoxin-type protein NapG [Gammaproteobacteria bacterium]
MDAGRREFLMRTMQGAAVAACGGLLWSHLLRQEAAAAMLALRPPGALAETDFAAACIKCGQCVDACPYDTLSLARAEDGAPIGTPYFVPRKVPCYMCTDFPCVPACPTGALDPQFKDIADARMGLAVIDAESCLSWQGLRCEVCYRVCPVKDTAITIQNHPRQLSKHAMFVPIVHSQACTGCGMCEEACPTEEAAIRVLNPKLVQGRIGDHYRLGWKGEPASGSLAPAEPSSAPTAPPPADTAIPEKAPGMDVLNEELEL